MKEKTITIKLSDLMERFKESTSNPFRRFMAKIDTDLFAAAMFADLFPEYADDIREYIRAKAVEEDAQNRKN